MPYFSPAFLYAVEHTLEAEGFFSNHSWDPGGKTKYGITEAVATKHGKKVEDLTKEDAIWIYHEDYWQAMHLNQLNSWYIAQEIFDTGVNAGINRAVKLTQRALNKVFGYRLQEDGKMGSFTLGAINETISKYERHLLAALNGMQFMYYLSLEDTNVTLYERAIKGWMLRTYPELPSIDRLKYINMSQGK